MDVAKSLFSNIILAGGCAMFPGLKTRLITEIKKLTPATNHAIIDVVTPERRDISAWQGGSVMGAILSGQHNMWMNLQEYQEHGIQRVHFKFA